MEEQRNIDEMEQVYRTLCELENEARRKRSDLEDVYDQAKFELDAVDEALILLDGEVNMIVRAKQRLGHLRFPPTTLEDLDC